MAENQSVESPKSNKELFLANYKADYPDLDETDEDSFYGRLNDNYTSNKEKMKMYEDDRQKLSDLFQSSPKSAVFMSEWANGENPVLALVKAYGQDFVDYMNDPENADAIAEAQKEYLDKVNKGKEFDDQFSENIKESVNLIESIQEQNQLSDEEAGALFEQILSVGDDLRVGMITPEIAEMFLKANNYDNDVDEARTEGEIAGKNAKIDKVLKLKSRGDGTPSLQGGNNIAEENPIKIEGALGREKQDIWEAGNPKRIRRQ